MQLVFSHVSTSHCIMILEDRDVRCFIWLIFMVKASIDRIAGRKNAHWHDKSMCALLYMMLTLVTPVKDKVHIIHVN